MKKKIGKLTTINNAIKKEKSKKKKKSEIIVC